MRLSNIPVPSLTDPDVELSILVGEEGHEPAVGRDFGLLFSAVPIRDARERGVGERVLLRSLAARRASHVPTATASTTSATQGSQVVAAPGTSERHQRRGRARQHFVDRVDLDPDVTDISQALSSGPSPGSGAAAVEWTPASWRAGPTSQARARGSSRSSPRPCRPQT